MLNIGNEPMILPKLWFTFSELCRKWNCEISDLLHLAETEQLSIFVNWQNLERQNTKSEFYFVQREGASEDFLGKSNFVENLHFSGLDDLYAKRDHAGRYKCQPLSNSHLINLAYCSPALIRTMIPKGEINFRLNEAEIVRNAEVVEYLEYSSNTGVYIGDFELIWRHWGVGEFVVSFDDLIVTKDEVKRFEDRLANVPDARPSKKVQSQSDNEDKNLVVIGVLLELLKDKRTQPYTQSLVIDKIQENYGDKGFSESKLTKLFSAANQTFRDFIKR